MTGTGTITLPRSPRQDHDAPGLETGRAPRLPSLGEQGVTGRLSAKERFAFLEQLATMLDSGVQIPAALHALREQNQEPRVGTVLGQLERSVMAGQPLSEAMGRLPRAFPPLLCRMVRAGEYSGAIAEVLRKTVELLEAEAELRAKLRSATLYPCVMVVLTVSVVVFLLAVIVPKFEKLFANRAADLPGPTRWLMALGDACAIYGPWVLAAVVVAVVAAVLYRRTTDGKRLFDALLLRIPLAGGIYRTSVLARSARTFGLLVRAGVPVHAALEHTEGVAGSPTYVDFWRRTRERVINGGSVTEAVKGSTLVSPMFQQVVAAGEATATLDAVMLRTAAQYTRDFERRIRDALTLIEPAMVVLMGGIVGFIALSIMLPIFRMARG